MASFQGSRLEGVHCALSDTCNTGLQLCEMLIPCCMSTYTDNVYCYCSKHSRAKISSTAVPFLSRPTVVTIKEVSQALSSSYVCVHMPEGMRACMYYMCLSVVMSMFVCVFVVCECTVCVCLCVHTIRIVCVRLGSPNHNFTAV